MENSDKITLGVELTFHIIDKYGQFPDTNFHEGFTPYNILKEVYTDFNKMPFNERIELIILIWDKLHDGVVSTVPDADYWYYVDGSYGILVKSDTDTDYCYFDIEDMVASHTIIDEYDIVRLKQYLVLKGVIKQEHTISDGRDRLES